MKHLKSILALLLALVMVLSLAACGGNSAEDTKAPAADDTTAAPAADDDTTAAADDTTASGLDWLNLGGVYPIVDEGVEKTLSVCLPIDDEYLDSWQDNFQYLFTVEQLNINLDVQPVASSAWGEKRPLILADTENLPDIIMNAGFTPGELMRYGTEEGLLLDVAPYITNEYMPCLTALFEDHPELKVPWTDADGHVYSFNYLMNTSIPDELQWFFLNYGWMEDCGMDPFTQVPTTLDEFTDLMRKFKEVKSAEFGEEIYPISGRYTGWNSVCRYLLVALGYCGNNRDDSFPGGQINLRNGEVVLPVADREGYEGFVKTLKLWYDEGLIHPEFFTGDAAALDALISQKKTGYVTVPVGIWIANEDCFDWWGAPLLTSQWSDKPAIPNNDAANGTGRHVITTACEEVELALAFFDFFYEMTGDELTQNYFWMTNGPVAGTPEADLYPELTIRKIDETGAIVWNFDPDKYNEANAALAGEIGLWGNVALGARLMEDENGELIWVLPERKAALVEKWKGKGIESWGHDSDNPLDDMTVASAAAFNMPYVADEQFPAIVYLDAATQERADELFVALKEFATTETAKFVVGERDIAELSDYFDEIDALGATEYVKIYADYYAALKG